MENQKMVKITLSGNGVTFEKEISEDLAGQIMSLCLSSSVHITPSHTKLTDTNTRERESVVEYYDRYFPKRNPDKILVFAGYLKEIENRDSFNPGEIKRLFRDAGEVLPANFVRDFGWVIRNGWVAADSEKKGNYFVTKTGMKVLLDGFPKELVDKTKNRGNKRKNN